MKKLVVTGSLCPLLTWAASPEASAWAGLFKVFLALAVILVAIVAVLGFMRRMMMTGLPGQKPLLHLRGGVMVGQRERIVVVEVQDTWLVVGVTPAEMTLLHSLPKGELSESTPPLAAPELLARWLKKRGRSE